MELLTLPIVEKLAEDAAWGDPPPPRFEEQEFDIRAFELWQRASLEAAQTEQEPADVAVETAVGCHSSCL